MLNIVSSTARADDDVSVCLRVSLKVKLLCCWYFSRNNLLNSNMYNGNTISQQVKATRWDQR